MYSNEQSRINAVISYFFLGPFFLFAKKNTPLSDPYVREHSKVATKYIGIMIMLYILYLFIYSYINYAIPWLGIRLPVIILAGIVGISLFLLAKWAYHAYTGVTPWENIQNLTKLQTLSNIHVSWVYTVEHEEEKSRILASMIPFLGIWIAKKYNHTAMIRARIIGSFFTFLYIISVLFSWEVWFIPFIIMILGIVLFVIEGIYLFIYNSFVSWNVLDKIPSYLELEGHIVASIKSIVGFFLVSFWKEKTWSYAQYYEEHISRLDTTPVNIEKYFMPTSLIWIPFWNIFTIPSLFIDKYKPYRFLIIEWLLITLFFSYFFFFRGDYSSPYLLLLLFPIIHILVYAKDNPETHAPGIWLIAQIFIFYKNTKKTLEQVTTRTTESFTYSTPIHTNQKENQSQ